MIIADIEQAQPMVYSAVTLGCPEVAANDRIDGNKGRDEYCGVKQDQGHGSTGPVCSGLPGSKIIAGISIPSSANSSMKRGRMPVARNSPWSRPFVIGAGLLEFHDLLHLHDLTLHAGDL